MYIADLRPEMDIQMADRYKIHKLIDGGGRRLLYKQVREDYARCFLFFPKLKKKKSQPDEIICAK